MQLGNIKINTITDGSISVDGGSMFGKTPKSIWETIVKPDRKNRIRVDMNSLVIQTPNQNILIDTGAGSKRVEKLKESHLLNGNKLIKNMKRLGLTARDIDTVILTHLHFDVAGGCTKLDRTGNSVPTFPNATYIVQKKAYEDAISPTEFNKKSFYEDDYVPIQEAGQMKLIEGEEEICPGVVVSEAGGHTLGHQVVKIAVGSERIGFLGELVPTHHHLNLEHISGFDQFPNETLQMKKLFIENAINNGWIIVFSHSTGIVSGYIQHKNKKFILLPVEI